MRVIIAGGGIGGLGAAVALRRAGHEVVILEQAAQLERAGAGITLFANAMNALSPLGVADAVRAAGAAARRSAILTSDGRELTTLPPHLLEGAIAVHRGELQAVLVEAAGEIRLGAELAAVYQSVDEVTAILTDGTEERGDLLIGADGLWSRVRASVAQSSVRYSGYTAWRAISRARVEPGQLTESWGAGERFGLVDIGSQTYWFATANAPAGQTDDPAERKAELMRRFAAWHPPIETILEATPNQAILRNDIHYLDPLPRWSHGRIVLIGDAAHASTPGIGQGAAQAIEDAVVLTNELVQHAEPHDAFARYEQLRRPQAEQVLRLSRRADTAAQLTSPLARRVRNLVVRRTPARVQSRQLAAVVHHQLP